MTDAIIYYDVSRLAGHHTASQRDTVGFLETVLDGSDALPRSIHRISSAKKAWRSLDANLLEESSPQHHLHAHSQDSDHTEDEDSPEQHGTNQGGGQDDVPLTARIPRPLGPTEWCVQSRQGGVRSRPLQPLVVVPLV